MTDTVCPNCGKPVHNTYRGLCRKCYRQLPDVRSKELSYSRKWYQEHRESEIKKNREYRRQNRELFNWYHNKDRFGGFKKEVMDRDSNMCQSCGTKEKLSVHHIDNTNYRKGNANNDLDNLMVLCTSCHSFLHNQQRRDGRIWSREDIVRTLARTKEMFRKEHPLRKKS